MMKEYGTEDGALATGVSISGKNQILKALGLQLEDYGIYGN